MNAAVIILSVAVAANAVAMWIITRNHQHEREQWQLERRELTNRVIARHTGEVVALDHSHVPRPDREPRQPVLIEGIS